jgi:hypothetical protein
MASADKLSVNVSAERLLCDALAELANKTMVDHNIQLQSVTFQWIYGPGGSQVMAVKTDSVAVMPLKRGDSESMN